MKWLNGCIVLAVLCSVGCGSDPSSSSSMSTERINKLELLVADRNWQQLLMLSLGKERGSAEVQAGVLLWETHLETTAQHFGSKLGNLGETLEEEPVWLSGLSDSRPEAKRAILNNATAALNEQVSQSCSEMKDDKTKSMVLKQARMLQRVNNRAKTLEISADSLELDPMLSSLFEAEKRFNELGESIAKPDSKAGTRPTYSKPQYTGSYYLSGRYKGPFTGDGWSGIVITRGDTIYVLKNGAKPIGYTDRLNGYVESSYPSTIMVSGLGRRERRANLVELVDKLDFKEDKAKHRSSIAQAKYNHKKRQAEYRQAQKDDKKAIAQWKRDTSARAKKLLSSKSKYESAMKTAQAEMFSGCAKGER